MWTQKNSNKLQVCLDFRNVCSEILSVSYHFDEYPGYLISLCICIKDETEFKLMKNRIEKTNDKLKKHIEQKDTIIIDWNDLNQAYHQFKMSYGHIPLDNIINSNKTILCLKMHQHLGVLKTLKMKSSEKEKILWGHIPRSGKSYIIAGCIIEYSKEKDECNYLVINYQNAIQRQIQPFSLILDRYDFDIPVMNYH